MAEAITAVRGAPAARFRLVRRRSAAALAPRLERAIAERQDRSERRLGGFQLAIVRPFANVGRHRAQLDRVGSHLRDTP